MLEWKKKKRVFNILGTVIIVTWIAIIGLLVKKVHFKPEAENIHGMQVIKAIDSPQQEWKEIFLKDRKVGYAVNLITPGKKGYLIQEDVFLTINLMGLANSIHLVTQCSVDNDFLLNNFNFRMDSGVVGLKISGRVEGDWLVVETGKGSDKKTRRIKLVSRPMIGAGIGYFFRYQKVKVGDVFNLPVFDPSTMAQKEAVIKVVARETVAINRIKYNAFRLETEMWGKLMTFWVGEDGTTLKEEGFMGLTAVKSSAASAPRGIEEGMDFYEITAISTDRKLHDSTRLNWLKVKFQGINNKSINMEILDSGRQKFQNEIMEITKEKPSLKVSYNLMDNRPGDEYRHFLKPEFNIESDDKEIIEKARQIAGTDNNPLSVSRKLMNWVYRNLKKMPVVSVPSAKEILRTKTGDCNEHATLLTALLRASGIPARLSIGLVYARNKFFYHAWNEAYIGQWVSMDATLNQIPADPTHIKLIEGNLDKQVEIAGLIGRLKLQILDYR